MPEPLLQTKVIVPPLRRQRVARPALDEKLRQARRVPLTLVSAPPGFGKTTAVLSALCPLQARGELALGWLAVDAADNEPARFWRYLLAALRQASGEGAPSLGAGALQALSGPQPAPLPTVLAPLLNDLAARPGELLLVLDDVHLLDHPQIFEGLAFLLAHAPPTFHLLLATRADPPLPLHRFRARAQLVEVRAHDLRFAEAEAAAFLRDVMRLPLADAQVARLVAQTEGWISGLQLAALAWQEADGAEPDLSERLAQSNRYIADYLAEEVLARQPAETRSFLLETAILERLCGSLCDAVTGTEGSGALLARLARRNLFVVPLGAGGEEEGWYRYHHLFADLLRGYLQRERPGSVPDLHRRASGWYEGRGEVEAAVAHALAGAAYAQVGRLLEAYGPGLAMAGRVLTLERWLQQMPAGELAALPRTNLAFAWALLLRGRYAEIEPYLRRAAAAIGDDPALRGEWHALAASLAGIRGAPAEALDHAEQALAEVGAENVFVQGLAHFALAGAQRELGELPAAIAAYERAIPLCRAARLVVPEMLARAHLGNLYLLRGRLQRAEAVLQPVVAEAQPVSAAARGALGRVLLEQNRLEEAEGHLRAALDLAEKSGHNAARVQVRIDLARLQRARGEPEAAQRCLEQAATHVAEGVPDWIPAQLAAEQGELWLDQGAPDPVVALLAEGEEGGELALLRARLLLIQERPAEARALLDTLIPRAAAQARRLLLLVARLLRARAALALAERAAAERDVQQALALAEPEGFVRVFVEAGPPLAELLATQEGDYARRLLAAFPPAVQAAARVTPPAAAALLEPLTARETEVLHLLARGLTYRQIAGELIVSVNTVRHHVKGLYGKLQANSRTQALQAARALGLLDG